MSNWLHVRGVLQKGYGVASGQSGDPRFPQGTIEMQKPYFAARGLSLDQYYSGTLNVSVFPYQYAIQSSKYTFRSLKWAAADPPEDFSFFDCKVTFKNRPTVEGLIYYPHPETKPEHFQASNILEVLAPFIQNLTYGDELILEVDARQIELSSTVPEPPSCN